MFGWSISKSAEAVFSRWAVKRVCKFLLKKKLGKFILGDIDLNQLDVQLGAGTIQLSDLALNVDYVNEKLGTTSILVKEGSVGSLMVTMPWKDGGCRIEVDELELVLAPRRVKVSRDDSGTCSHSENGNTSSNDGLRKPVYETLNSGAASVSVDVHEGVKTIAKMVKWLLTSFHVKIKKLIIAFDPLLEEEKDKGLDRILVLRITEAECGTHISEDASSSSPAAAHNFLGLSRLTNFVKFQGAVLELLHLDSLDHQSLPEFSAEKIADNWFSGYCSSGNMTTLVSGEKGGFSGNLKLSLPWKNGTLDIRKVDADLHIEPLELRLQPCTIRFIVSLWDLFKGLGEESDVPVHREPLEDFSPSSHVHPSEKGIFGNDGFVTEKEPVHTLLSESHLISDWVSRSQKDGNEEEPDFGASVDQFFECFDGLRNSQSALGNSGMWNWTCSVFSAITAASNLATGSLHVPSEQQHVETNFNASIGKVAVLVSFVDQDQKRSPKIADAKANSEFDIHCLCTQFVDLCLTVQARPREMNFEVIVQHIQLVDHLCSKNDLLDKAYNRNDNLESEILLIKKVQDGVQGALLTFQDSKKDPGVGHQVNYTGDISLSRQDINRCCHMTNGKDIYGRESSVTLLKTSGVSQCHVRLNSGSSGGSFTGPISFSLKLPPFVSWVNIELIIMILEFLKEMETCIETNCMDTGLAPDLKTNMYGSSPLSDQKMVARPQSISVRTKNTLEGNIFLPNARIILCFPVNEQNDIYSHYLCNQFIAFDFISPTIGGKDARSAKLTPFASSNKRHTPTRSDSLTLNFGDFSLFSISSHYTAKDRLEASFSVEKIISVLNGTGHLSLVSMLWQEDPETGPWIVNKARFLACSENGRSENKVVGKGCDYASVTTVKDSKDFNARTQQEIVSSSAFFLHVVLPPVTINLVKSQYDNICGLLNQTFERFSCIVSESGKTKEAHPALQTSILFECDSLTVTMAINPAADVKCSIRSELPGSWSSLTLQVDKFELLSVSDIGGIRSANFMWVAHSQGSLWGSITEGLHREFLLISCSDSAAGRGDGEGSNLLSSRYSGSDIINLWDPESNHSYTSVTVRCVTIVAIGGRLDWFSMIFSFFSLPSSEFEQADESSMDKTCESSFILNLVDIGLSYEPYVQCSNIKYSDLNTSESKEDCNVACLLAASSLKLSNTAVVDCTEGEYKIRLQDLGFLLCTAPRFDIARAYSGEHLSKTGYVKVAQEAHIEALLRTNCENGHAWELECADSHIMLNTCHDTTFGLIKLAAQLQKLFAPDMQDYVAHLENRWNNVQQVQEVSNERTAYGDFSPSLTRTATSSLDNKSKVGNLMDEICEDVFQLDGNSDGQAKFFESHLCTFVNESSLVANEAPSSSSSLSDGNTPFIEEYFLSDLRPLAELTLKSQPSDVLCWKAGTVAQARIGNDGWYSDTSLRILENHASKVDQSDVRKPLDFEVSSSDHEHVDVGKAEGRVLLKNMNVVWRMYGGSDWPKSSNTPQICSRTCARDATICFELSLSGIDFDYEVYPDGEISASRLSLSIQDFCLNDRSDDAPWKLVLGYYQSKKHPRKVSSKAVKLNMEAVRPDPSIHIEENRLRIALLPMRLHLHQSQLDFLISFFGGRDSPADSCNAPLGLSKSGQPFEKSDILQDHAISEEAFLTYFQKFDIWPMLIRVDYSPRSVDLTALRGGKYVELVNLVPWKGVELQLKHVQGVGLYGWSSICETILGEWLEDISQNQIHKLLKGLPPIKSLVAVGSGAAKLVSLPVKSYKKDHRLLKGMQRGTFAFLRSISLEAIGLGVHLAAGAHNVLLQAEYILASIPPSVPWPVENKISTNVRSNQPNDAQQGIQQACQSISDGLGKSASALVQSPFKKYQRGASIGSALATAVQSTPAAAIAPASAAARALHCALLGIRNSLDPERKRESREKYLGRTPPQDFMQ